MVPVGAACSLLQEQPKSRDVSQFAINAKQELHSIRDWLGCLRSEVDAGIVRLEIVLSNLNAFKSGQVSRVASRIPKFKKTFKPKNRYWARKKKWALKITGGNSGIGPNEDEGTSTSERPNEVDKSTRREAVPYVEPVVEHSGLMVVIGCLEGS